MWGSPVRTKEVGDRWKGVGLPTNLEWSFNWWVSGFGNIPCLPVLLRARGMLSWSLQLALKSLQWPPTITNIPCPSRQCLPNTTPTSSPHPIIHTVLRKPSTWFMFFRGTHLSSIGLVTSRMRLWQPRNVEVFKGKTEESWWNLFLSCFKWYLTNRYFNFLDFQ